MTANIITVCRIILSIILIFLTPNSSPFYMVYILCGFTDMLDGFVARKTHSESDIGAKLDSIADITFVAVCLIYFIQNNLTFGCIYDMSFDF